MSLPTQTDSACFCFETDPNLEANSFIGSLRKLSCDDIIGSQMDQANQCQHQTPIMESIYKCKGRKSPVQSRWIKKAKRNEDKPNAGGECQQTGHWQIEQNKRYHWFLELHSEHFINKHMRRMDRIFTNMQTFIGSRKTQQCRSHHQKMEKKYGNFIGILSALRMLIYGADDIACVIQDMRSNGIKCSAQSLNSNFLVIKGEKIGQNMEVKQQTTSGYFVDPLADMNCQHLLDLQLLAF